MSEEKNATLVFIPLPGLSHLIAVVKAAKLMAERDKRLSIQILIMKPPSEYNKLSPYITNSPNSQINFIELPQDSAKIAELPKAPASFLWEFLRYHTVAVRAAVAEIQENPQSGKVAGFVLDMFCTDMIDVANEFRIPSYIFFTCGSGSLGLMLHLQRLEHEQHRDLRAYENSDFEVSVPTFSDPVPAGVWPSAMFDEDKKFLVMLKRFRETKGILLNSFLEFETRAIESLAADEGVPKVYPVGPILQSGQGEVVDGNDKAKNDEIMRWLDGQPDSSVVFLCFGSKGFFDGDQIREIARALEGSRHRFLWSLRKAPPKEKRREMPGEYEDPKEILPEGFLERTSGIGKVIGWAPQMAILSHRAVGGFVSHCGWNSILESVWCGVPLAAWPLHAEQQINAFEMVKELGMAEAIRLDYQKDWRSEEPPQILPAEEIEAAIKRLMAVEEGGSGMRRKVKEMQGKSRKALEEGGSSYNALGHFIEDVFKTVEQDFGG